MRTPYQPLSHDDDHASRRHRYRRIHRDIGLHLAAHPCPGCGQHAWLSGGRGCDCITALDLVTRCQALARTAP